MLGKTHLKITLASMFGLYVYFEWDNISTPFVIGGIIGSFLPDCDTKKSKAGIIPAWLFFTHRTYTHSMGALMWVTMLANFIDTHFAFGLGVGYFLHLLADLTTKNGLKYKFYPLVRPKVRNKHK